MPREPGQGATTLPGPQLAPSSIVASGNAATIVDQAPEMPDRWPQPARQLAGELIGVSAENVRGQAEGSVELSDLILGEERHAIGEEGVDAEPVELRVQPVEIEEKLQGLLTQKETIV